MPDDTFASYGHRVENMVGSLKNPKLKALMTDVGVKAKGIATKAASADLGGDPKFSGWAPTLDTRFDHVGEGKISFHPSKKAAGPWTVAEFGRNQTAGPFMSGPKLTKTGKKSKAKAKKWNGRTKGKGTATDALTGIEAMFPKMVDKHVSSSIAKFFN